MATQAFNMPQFLSHEHIVLDKPTIWVISASGRAKTVQIVGFSPAIRKLNSLNEPLLGFSLGDLETIDGQFRTDLCKTYDFTSVFQSESLKIIPEFDLMGWTRAWRRATCPGSRRRPAQASRSRAKGCFALGGQGHDRGLPTSMRPTYECARMV